MTPQETQTLQDFLAQLVQAGSVNKDPQAEQQIARAVAQQPDAAYLLVQRALLLDIALSNAKARIAQLERAAQAAAPASSGSFLNPSDGWGNSAPAQPLVTTPAPAPYAYAPPAQPVARGPAAPAYVPGGGFFGGGMGNMLGTVAMTAAGVAGGAFLYQGLENMLHARTPGNPDHPGAHQSGLLDDQAAFDSQDQQAFSDMLPSDQDLSNDA